MTANERKVSRKYEAFIAAMLTHPTIAEAAQHTHISEATALRWLKLPEVQDAYRDARRQIVTHALTTIQHATSDAVEALRRSLTAGSGAVQVSAARTILEFGVRAVEIDDLAARLEHVEAALAQQQDSKQRQRRRPWSA